MVYFSSSIPRKIRQLHDEHNTLSITILWFPAEQAARSAHTTQCKQEVWFS